MSNVFKTTLLLTIMTLLLMLAGRAFGGQNGMLIALAFAAVMNFVSYFFSDKIALAAYRAQPVTREDLPRVYNGLGIAILSTPRGVMSDNEARAANVGGEVLCRVF